MLIGERNDINIYANRETGAIQLKYRLPTESEWEYAALGLTELSRGGPYLMNDRGCFLANFKPLRGNYVADGGHDTFSGMTL